MNRIGKFIVITVVLAVALSLLSCIDRLYGFDTDLPTGELLTPEMIESIIDAATVEVSEKYPIETSENGEIIIYWLPGGSVWHVSKNCSSVAKADPENVRSGSVANAITEGKDRPCKICAGEIEYDISYTDIGAQNTNEPESVAVTTSGYHKVYSEDGRLLVYWTKNGSVWHESVECPSLANSDKSSLASGSEDAAVEAGKERVCKKCS